MAKPKKSKTDDGARKTNGFDSVRCKEVVDRVETLRGEIRAVLAETASEVGVLRQDIGEVMKEAKAAWGIPTAVLKLELDAREGARKIAERRAKLEADDQHAHDMLREALGDFAHLPLGEAALSASAPPAGNGAEILAGLNTL